jgi:curli biogenesis system outer membrane secretion channel CsgG
MLRSKRHFARTAMTISLMGSLAACGSTIQHVEKQRVASDEMPVQIGSSVRDNLTPMEGALACFAHALSSTGRPPLVIGVGDVKDYTGRYSINEGNAVTQGGSLMLFSALGKLGGTVRVAERFDSAIAERELGYMDRRQLGNGESHEVNGQKVPWMPYYGGTIQVSDYYITGGITEVNYNIASGGAEAGLDNVTFKRRTYTQSVAVDLRIVDTRTLLVVDAVSLSKQFRGYEVGANSFRFLGLSLVDINLGEKGQEPMQLGIRAAIEEAAMRLIGRVSMVNPAPCLALRTSEIQTDTSEKIFGKMAAVDGTQPMMERPEGMANPAQDAPPFGPTKPLVTIITPPPARPTASPKPSQPSPAVSLNADEKSAQEAPGAVVQIPFEIGDPNLAGPAQAILDRIAKAGRGTIMINLVSRDSENLDPSQRGRLLDQRVASLFTALANRGVPLAAMSVMWRPEVTDQSVYRDGPGIQLLARVKIVR